MTYTLARILRDRRSVLAHLREVHDYDWHDDEGMAEESTDPLGWHRPEGGYVFPTAEALVIHREIHTLEEQGK
jgi:hypothetical protein